MHDAALRGYANRLRIGVLAVFAIFLLLVLLARLGSSLGGIPVAIQGRTGASSGPLRPGDGVLLLLSVAIYWLSEGLRAIGRGDLFSTKVVRCFRLFSLSLLLMAIYSSAVPMLFPLAKTANHPIHRLLILIDVRDLLLIGLTLLLLLIARMFERARVIEHEMSEIV